MHKLTPDYIIGLVDGEGSFTAYVKNPNSISNRRVRVEPRFYVKLIEKDKDILYSLQQFFGCGSVYFQKDKRPTHQDCYRYEVFNRDDLNSVIIPFFKKNKLKFFSKKYDFKIFSEIMKMISKKEHLNKSGLKKIYALKQKMH